MRKIIAFYIALFLLIAGIAYAVCTRPEALVYSCLNSDPTPTTAAKNSRLYMIDEPYKVYIMPVSNGTWSEVGYTAAQGLTQYTLTGGGNVVWWNNYGLSWDGTFHAIDSEGSYSITMPALGTVIEGLGSCPSSTVSSFLSPVIPMPEAYEILLYSKVTGSLYLATALESGVIPSDSIIVAAKTPPSEGTIKVAIGVILGDFKTWFDGDYTLSSLSFASQYSVLVDGLTTKPNISDFSSGDYLISGGKFYQSFTGLDASVLAPIFYLNNKRYEAGGFEDYWSYSPNKVTGIDICPDMLWYHPEADIGNVPDLTMGCLRLYLVTTDANNIISSELKAAKNPRYATISAQKFNGNLIISDPTTTHRGSNLIDPTSCSNYSIGAFLCSGGTFTAGIYAEKVVNGTFDADLSSWTAGSFTWYSAGTATHSSGTASLTQQVSGFTLSEIYRFSFSATRAAGSVSAYLFDVFPITISSSGSYTYDEIATAETQTIRFTPLTTFKHSIDNVSIIQQPSIVPIVFSVSGFIPTETYEMVFMLSSVSAGNIYPYINDEIVNTLSTDGTYTMEFVADTESEFIMFQQSIDFIGQLNLISIKHKKGGNLTAYGDISAGRMVRQGGTWHAYGGFQQLATAITCTEDAWEFITSPTNTLFTQLEGDSDGIPMSGDVWTFTNAGHYEGELSISMSGGANQDVFIRSYNITQAAQCGYVIGGTTTGANNYLNIAIPIYCEINANDQMRFEFMNITNSNAITFRSAIYKIKYLHD